MLRNLSFTLLGTALIMGSTFAQTSLSKDETIVIKGTFLGETPPVLEFASEFDFDAIDYSKEFEIPNFKDRYRKSPVERNLYPRLDALWSPLVPESQKVPQASLVQNFNGISYTGVQPPDPCMAASATHVVQMINGSGGAVYKVWDKSGNSLTAALSFDSFFPGYSGLGDPIVLFDQLANRWFLSEFSSSGNRLLIAVSVTSDPLGSFYTYEFQASNFPDYPKYSVWHDAYYCTANENKSSLYAFQRDSMLVGAPANLIRKTVSNLSGFGFQTLTPVYFEGTNTTNSPATFWRHVDDEAHYPGQADPFSDWVEYWTFIPDFTTPNNSVFLGPSTITVTDFDSDLNGYYAFSAINQPGTNTRLDPLREVFMNRMNYRNFGIFESLVACHVTDIDGTDWAGMRWYEFRKTDTTNWALYQEGTYAPDSDSRWMAGIDINSNGSICMAYSVSSTSTYPSLRFTGRNANDSLGKMTLPEQVIIAGGGSNSSNRYGDYASMTVDPADDSTFWFTGEFNPTSTWKTRIAQIQLTDACNGLMASVNQQILISCVNDSNAQISVHTIGGPTGIYTYSLDGLNYQSSNIFSNLPAGDTVVTIKNGTCETQVSVTIDAPEAILVNNTITDVSCNGLTDGSIVVNANGGTPPFLYSLDNSTWVTSSTFNALGAGNYTVYIKDNMNCITPIDSIEVIEPTEIIIIDSIIPASSSTTADGKVYLNVTGGAPSYLYSMDNISFTASNLFANLLAGTYSFYVTDDNGCSASIHEVLLYSVSINELFTEENLVIYPNPSSGMFSVKMGAEIMRFGVEISVRDVTGKEVFATSIEPTASEYLQNIDLSNFAKGVYIMDVKAENNAKTIKVILK